MQTLSPEGLRIVAEIATRHGVSLDAALGLLDALVQGNGRQAQFNHADLGGMGQWSQGGMIMIGDMFNQGLKYRVDTLCNELAGLLHKASSHNASPAAAGLFQPQSRTGGSGPAGQWWPADLGDPASAGAQNDMKYAFFPIPRRLAIQRNGRIDVYDTGDHRLSGFSQQQGGDQSLTFTSPFGPVRVADLPLVAPSGGQSEKNPAPPAAQASKAARSAAPATDEVLRAIEGLAALRQKNILTEEEFSAKKAELLSRL